MLHHAHLVQQGRTYSWCSWYSVRSLLGPARNRVDSTSGNNDRGDKEDIFLNSSKKSQPLNGRNVQVVDRLVKTRGRGFLRRTPTGPVFWDDNSPAGVDKSRNAHKHWRRPGTNFPGGSHLCRGRPSRPACHHCNWAWLTHSKIAGFPWGVENRIKTVLLSSIGSVSNGQSWSSWQRKVWHPHPETPKGRLKVVLPVPWRLNTFYPVMMMKYHLKRSCHQRICSFQQWCCFFSSGKRWITDVIFQLSIVASSISVKISVSTKAPIFLNQNSVNLNFCMWMVKLCVLWWFVVGFFP